MERPFAFRPGEASEAEMFGVLSGFHLPEHRFNDRFASGVVRPSRFRTHPVCHAFTLGRVFRDPSSGCVPYPFVAPDLPCRYDSVDPPIGELLEIVL